jgi:hypothetical protein
MGQAETSRRTAALATWAGRGPPRQSAARGRHALAGRAAATPQGRGHASTPLSRDRAEAAPTQGPRARAGTCPRRSRARAGAARPRRDVSAPGSSAAWGRKQGGERGRGAGERDWWGKRRCRGRRCWRSGARAARVRVGAAGPLVGPLVGRIELEFCFFFLFFSNFEILIQIIIKSIKNSKLFINKVFISVLLIIISFTRIFI